ncbi:hypothetical protein VSVS12_03443 [Vibrio scophthalmi]|uniref:Ig-like domain-containing protein n=1 Tax=Vibrio scophthalmi TaxID=45658 RepID=UPI0008095C5C|nr:Ig-like domain-containing protein [Vibrio scophthalmi]ANS87152.1 hypothetical protein VSVS12_03443 [Vibrio scophthalmi]
MTQLLFYPIRALSLIWLLLFTSLCAQAETTAIQPDGYIDGQGGEIATLAHLRWLSETPDAWDENWQQTQNIDAAESKLWNNGQGFRPIGDSTSQGYISGVSFSGSYNGNGYSISSLFIHNPQFSYIGMFGYLSRAQVSNLSLKQIYVKGRDHVGGLAGYAYNSTLTNLRVTGEIEGNENIGGILGSSRSDIHQAFSDVIVRGKSDLGGIVGEMMSAKSLSNSVSHGQLYSSNSGAGGLIGRARGYVINSYTTVALPPSKPSFGLYGIDHDIKSITNSYFDCEVGGIEGNNDDCYNFTTNTNSHGRPTAFLKSAANFSDWPQATSWEAGVWRIIDGQYPALTTQRLPLFDLPTDILPDKIASEDQYFSLQTIASSNQVNQSIRYSLIGAPSWLSIDSNGLLAGVPAHNHTSQSSTIIVVAEQGTQRNYLPSFTLSVTPQNDAPIVEVPSQFSITHNKRVTLNLSDWVIDEEQGQFIYSINNGPSKAHLTLTPAGQATLVAKSPFVGFDSFSVWVEDGEHKIKQTVSYTIATSDTVSDGFWLVEEDSTQAIDFSIIAGGNTNPSVSIVAAPNHGAITAQSGRIFYYTPRANFSGEDNFTALIDGYLSNITLHVYSISDALTTQPTSITIEEDQVVDINLANAINDPDSTKLSFSKVSALKGELTKLSESVYRYHPEANYSGQYIIQFSAFDAERASVEANIDLTINSVNDAPTVQNIHTSNYKKFTIPLHKIISDIDSENITYRLLQYSSLGRASINGSTFWYTPGSVEGEDKVTIQVSDGETTSEFDINIRITTLPVEPADYDGYSGTITTLAELRWLTDTEEAWSKDWQLGADIDASLTRTWQLTDHDKQAHTTEMEGGFMPIGNGRTAFTGSFDGNNYTISNLYINQPYAIGIAFFDTLVNASIKDLHLTNAEIHGRIYVGGIASKSTNSVLDNVHYTGQVFGGHRVGGLISEDRGSTLSHSSVEGTISGLIYVGGAVGYQEKYTPKDSMLLPVESRVQANIIKADVVGVTSVGGLIGKSKESYVLDNHFGANIQGKDKVGGIIGEGYKMTLNRNSVEANIFGSQYLGGIAGHLDVTNELNNNYSHGSITGESSIGGLIGKQKGSTTHILADSYTTMALYGNSNIGGLYASLSGDPHNSFYDCQLGFDDCADIYAKYTRDLKIPETFTIAGWSEADAWNQGAWLLVEGNYPKLRQHPVPLFNSPTEEIGQLTLDEGESVNQTINVIAVDNSFPLKYSLSDHAPNWLSIDSHSGELTGTPKDSDVGLTNNIIISVSQGPAHNQLPPFTVLVNDINNPPNVTEGTIVLNEGASKSIDLSTLVHDVDNRDKLTYAINLQPISGKANVTMTPAGIALYTTIDNNFNGSDEFSFTATDGHSDPVQGKVSVTVNNVNDIPQAKNGTLSLDEGGSKQLDLSQFVTDTDTSDLLQFHLEQASSNGKAIVSVTQEGLATYTSNDDDYFGQDTFYYSVTDGHSTPVVGIINVTITNLNDIPTTADGSMVLLEGGQQELNLTHLVSDSDSIDTLTFSLFKQPTSGKANVSISASGIATYTTNDDDFIGHDEFYYAVSDGHSDPVLGKVSVTVNNVNDIPQAKNGTLSLDEGGSKILNLHTLVNDDDASDLLTFTLENSANSGKADISITSDGIATYTLTDGNFNGQDKFSFRVNDQNNSTATAEVMVTVHAVNDTPIANDHQLTTNEDTAISVDIHSLFSDPDVDDAHLFSVSQPTSGQAIVELAGSVVTFIPIGEHNGYDSFLYSVTDSENQTDTALIQVRVDNNNDAPIISGSPQQQIFVGEHYDFIPDISDSDPDDEHWFSIDNQPSWTHFNQMTGQLSGTPKASDVGKSTDNITITVTDRGNLSASLDTFSIEVTQQQPEAVDDTISLYSNTSETYTLSVLDNDSHPTDLPLTLSSAITNDGQIRIINNQLILTMNHPFSHVELNYTIKDENEQTDSANVSLSINRSYEEDVPEVQVPADVSVYARSLFTRVQLTPPAAINQTGDVLPAKLLDPYAPLLPGRHDIRWLITDRDNNATVTTQIVDIHPMISLGKDATVGNDVEQYRVPFVLNGLSPSYPVTIPYQIFRHDNSSRSLIDSGVIAILDGTTAYLDLNVPNTDAVDPTSILSVKIDKTQTDQGHLLNISDRDEFTLYAQYESLSPTVESRVYQRGQQRHWVDRLSLITLKAIVKNPDDNANYQFNWQYHTDITPVLVEDGKLILDPSDLEEGIHKVTVFVHRSDTPTTVTEHEIYFEQTNLANLSPDNDSDGDLIPDQEEGYADEDLDGFPDYLDDLTSCHMMPAYANQEQRYLVEVEPGLCLHKGTTIANAMTSGLLVDPNNQEIAPDTGQNYIGGVYDFAISGLSHGGQLASIVLPQKLPIPANAVYRKHLHNRWQDFADDINGLNQDPLLANGWVSSARGEAGYCPPPQSANTDGSPWYFGLNEGDWCVQLTIRDGGKNDADGLANGVILDPSGYATLNSDNQAPIALNDYYDVEQDDYAQYINVLSNDSDPNGNSLHITSVSIIEGLGHVDIQNNMLFFDSVNSVIGETIIQYTISDGLLPSTATATINVKRKKVRQSGTVYLFSTFVLIFIAFIRRKAK